MLSRAHTCFALITALLAGCGGGNGETRSDGGCRNRCEESLWPRVIVGITPPPGYVGDEADAASATLRHSDGSTPEAYRHGCPVLQMGAVRCSWSFFVSPNDRSVEIAIRTASGAEARRDFDPGPYSACAVNLTYLPVAVGVDGAVSIEAPVLFSPCESSSEL